MAIRRHAAGSARAASGRMALCELQLAAPDRAGRCVPSAVCNLSRNEPGAPVRRLLHVLELRRGFARRVSRRAPTLQQVSGLLECQERAATQGVRTTIPYRTTSWCHGHAGIGVRSPPAPMSTAVPKTVAVFLSARPGRKWLHHLPHFVQGPSPPRRWKQTPRTSYGPAIPLDWTLSPAELSQVMLANLRLVGKYGRKHPDTDEHQHSLPRSRT